VDANSIQTFAYHNDTDDEVVLIVEPWIEEYRVPARSSVDIVVRGARLDGVLEMAPGEEVTTVFGYPGSMVSIVKDGHELEPFTNLPLEEPEPRTPVPDLPPGMRTSDFLGLLGLRKPD